MAEENTFEFSVKKGMVYWPDFISQLEKESGSYQLLKSRKKGSVPTYNVPAAFDIETSSFYVDDEKCACMYIWMLGIGTCVGYGRTWQELHDCLDSIATILHLGDSARLVVYVHNLSYEWQFMRKHFNWDKCFFMDNRQPLYCITEGFEFRCSLKLTNKSLANCGKDLLKYPVQKMVGDLDYSLLRHNETPLTEKELGYCENDIRVLLSLIQEKIEQDGNIHKIPYTLTGYVRDFCRTRCFR